jgi:hypothetical protein
VIPDLIKVCIAAAILPGLWAMLGRSRFGDEPAEHHAR